MNNLGKKILNATRVTAFILSTLFLAGCGDSEMTKGITDAVKKSVDAEVVKKGEEIKKQFDQVRDRRKMDRVLQRLARRSLRKVPARNHRKKKTDSSETQQLGS
jgi:hypothetical protein